MKKSKYAKYKSQNKVLVTIGGCTALLLTMFAPYLLGITLKSVSDSEIQNRKNKINMDRLIESYKLNENKQGKIEKCPEKTDFCLDINK